MTKPTIFPTSAKRWEQKWDEVLEHDDPTGVQIGGKYRGKGTFDVLRTLFKKAMYEVAEEAKRQRAEEIINWLNSINMFQHADFCYKKGKQFIKCGQCYTEELEQKYLKP